MHLGNEFFPYQNCEDSESATEKKENMPLNYIYVNGFTVVEFKSKQKNLL